MKDEILHALSEEIQEQDYCIVSYYTELACGADPYEGKKSGGGSDCGDMDFGSGHYGRDETASYGQGGQYF